MENVKSILIKTHPNMSFFTIHDAIAVPRSYSCIVKNVVDNELTRYLSSADLPLAA